MDLGAGDGRFVLAHAAGHPERLALAVDASAEAMRDAARRAGRPVGRGGIPNARFVVSAVEALPDELAAIADLVTVHLPWGSLRDAVTGLDPTATARVTRLVRPGGALRILLSDADRDGRPPLNVRSLATTCEALGLRPVEVRPATFDDATAVHSSWGKRLLRNPDPARSAWWLRFDHPAEDRRRHG